MSTVCNHQGMKIHKDHGYLSNDGTRTSLMIINWPYMLTNPLSLYIVMYVLCRLVLYSRLIRNLSHIEVLDLIFSTSIMVYDISCHVTNKN